MWHSIMTTWDWPYLCSDLMASLVWPFSLHHFPARSDVASGHENLAALRSDGINTSRFSRK
jgi:hypothetical protein